MCEVAHISGIARIATTVIFANRSYVILNVELKRVGAERGSKAMSMLDLGNPALA